MRSQMGRGAFAWAMLAPALAFGQTAGSSGSLALHWGDPNALAPTSEGDFEARLAERLGRPAFESEASAQHTLSVSWEGTTEQCRVELQLLRGAEVEGTRRLESPSGDCKSLGPALLTVAALLVESRLSEAPAEPAEKPNPHPPASEAAPQPDDTETPPPKSDREPTVLLSLGAQLSSGLAPKLELGPAAALLFAPVRHLRLGVFGAFYVPHEYGARPGLQLGHMAAAALTCGMPLTGSLGLGVCASATMHRWTATGISLPHPEASQTFTWSAGLAVRVEWRLVKRLWWVGSVGADLSTVPLYFYFEPAPGGEMVLFRQQRLSPHLFLGLTLELP